MNTTVQKENNKIEWFHYVSFNVHWSQMYNYSLIYLINNHIFTATKLAYVKFKKEKRMKKILSDIKSLGVKVALDDFGTGYSSLNHIRELPIDIIKIDRCFIIDIGKDEYAEAFVKMVSELAETIGVRICVEGVEETEQVEKLRSMKVQYIQGYYYGKPMRAEDFEKKYL
mgnify:CR=1 FL=1